MTDSPRVIALVATRFRSDLLVRLLESLHRQSIRPLAAVICDNGPDPETVEVSEKSPLPCELISPKNNLGFGGGLAAAGQLAFEKFPDLSHLLVVDDDTILAPKDLESLLASATKAQIFSRGNEFAMEGGLFGGIDGGGVGAVVADHGGDWAQGLEVEGFEKAGEKIGAEAGCDQGHNLGCVRHHLKLAYRVACGEWQVSR